MHIDFLGIQAFLAIVECGSFQLAAAQLNLSQAAISHRLRKLENTLSVRLIARTTREFMLTDAGSAFLPRARGAVQELALSCEAVRNNRENAKNWISFACMPTLAAAILPRILEEFALKHPQLSVRVFDNSIHEVPELVEAGAAAFGVTALQSVRGDLLQTDLIDEPFVVVCRVSHPFASVSQVSWRELQSETLIRIRLPFDNLITIDDSIGVFRESPNWRYETQRHALALQMVRQGLALTVVPKLHLPSDSELVGVPLVEPSVSRKLSLIERRRGSLTGPEQDIQDLVVTAITMG